MVTLNIKTDFPEVQRKLAALRKDIAGPALASAINKGLAIAKTAVTKEIPAEFNLTAGDVRQRLQIQRAASRSSTINISGALSASNRRGRSANIILFAEKSITLAQSRKRAKAGTLGQVFVKIKRKGGRKPLGPLRFIGNKGRTVFERTGTGRKIKAVQTIDVASMFNSRRVNGAVLRVLGARLPDLVNNEVAFYIRRAATRAAAK